MKTKIIMEKKGYFLPRAQDQLPRHIGGVLLSSPIY